LPLLLEDELELLPEEPPQAASVPAAIAAMASAAKRLGTGVMCMLLRARHAARA
jgi:hypothetical protein